MENKIKCPRCGSEKIRKYNEDCIMSNGGRVESNDCIIRSCLESECGCRWKKYDMEIPTATEKKCPRCSGKDVVLSGIFELRELSEITGKAKRKMTPYYTCNGCQRLFKFKEEK